MGIKERKLDGGYENVDKRRRMGIKKGKCVVVKNYKTLCFIQGVIIFLICIFCIIKS